jgi:hypothetical protein
LKAPKLAFEKKVYHINVDPQDLSICLPEVTKWTAESTLRDVVKPVIDLMRTPNADVMVNDVIYQHYKDSYESYLYFAREVALGKVELHEAISAYQKVTSSVVTPANFSPSTTVMDKKTNSSKQKAVSVPTQTLYTRRPSGITKYR